MTDPFPSLTADFDHPIEVLDHCHARIRRNCRLIERIASRIRERGPDPDSREAARSVVRFFDTAGADHHRDEEEDLFPALLQVADSAGVVTLLSLLHADHLRLEAEWYRMRQVLEPFAAGGDFGPRLEDAQALTAAYERHIALEESELLPLARRLLDPKLAERLGLHMAARRGAKRPIL